MSYSREIEQRIDALRPDWPGVFKQKMFGGLGYMLDGHICVGVFKDYLIVRCGPEATADAPDRLTAERRALLEVALDIAREL